jgi:Flp pilus assembly CpaE family ATPase
LSVCEILAQRSGDDKRILLLDFSHPPAKVPDLLGARATYFMTDGVHDLARLDETMIGSAILRAPYCNLYVLPLAGTERGLNTVSVDDLAKLLAVLRSYFSTVVADIAWPWRLQLATRLFTTAEHRVLCTSQAITSIHSASTFLEHVRDSAGSDLPYLLAVTRYEPTLKPTPVEIQQALRAPDAPFPIPEDRQRIDLARNAGEPLVLTASRTHFGRAAMRLADALTQNGDKPAQARGPRLSGFLKRLSAPSYGHAPSR